jgi:Na+/H+-dicarboxylate symporter
MATKKQAGFTTKIFIGLVLGIIVGVVLKPVSEAHFVHQYMVSGVFDIGGKIFIAILQMLVVPIVFVSLICGTCKMHDTRKLGLIALKTFTLYLMTTALAIALAIVIAMAFNIGSGLNLTHVAHFTLKEVPSVKSTLINIIPTNPFRALSQGNMLQVILFALLIGSAMASIGKKAKKLVALFDAANAVLIQLVHIVLWVAPFGVFCLMAKLFTTQGFGLIASLLSYFFTVCLVLALQWTVAYGLLLRLFTRLSVFTLYKKILSALCFAFSTSSSSASIPVVLDAVENKVGVSTPVAAFVIPLGATINMDGTAIMQGVATVFIAHIYAVPIGWLGYLTVILMATLASIGTAGVPGVGLITLAMVLQQVGLPIEGISLIIGIDRLLDMMRTAVNVSGDCVIATIIAKSEGQLDEGTFKQH